MKVRFELRLGRFAEYRIRIQVRRDIVSKRRTGIVKVIVIVVLAILVGVAFMLMTQEQEARSAAESAHAVLVEEIDSGLTPEEVHEKLGRDPHETRIPGKNRFVEEYYWSGPMSEHTVYAYYSTGAAKYLEAASINEKMDNWEGDSTDTQN